MFTKISNMLDTGLRSKEEREIDRQSSEQIVSDMSAIADLRRAVAEKLFKKKFNSLKERFQSSIQNIEAEHSRKVSELEMIRDNQIFIDSEMANASLNRILEQISQIDSFNSEMEISQQMAQQQMQNIADSENGEIQDIEQLQKDPVKSYAMDSFQKQLGEQQEQEYLMQSIMQSQQAQQQPMQEMPQDPQQGMVATASEANISKKDDVDYVGMSHFESENCSRCDFFDGKGSCSKVSGDISPFGWCSLFRKTW